MKNILRENMIRFGTKNLNEGTVLGSLNDFRQNLNKLTNNYYSGADKKRIRLSDDYNKLFIQGEAQAGQIIDATSPDAFYIVKQENAEGAPMVDPDSFEGESPYYLGGGNMQSDQMIGKDAARAAQYIVKYLYTPMIAAIKKANASVKQQSNDPRVNPNAAQ